MKSIWPILNPWNITTRWQITLTRKITPAGIEASHPIYLTPQAFAVIITYDWLNKAKSSVQRHHTYIKSSPLFVLCALLSKHIFGRGQSFPPLRSAGPKTYKNMFLRLEIDARQGSECQRKNSYDWAPFVFFVAKSHLWLWVVTLKYRFKMHLIDAQIRDFRGLLDVCSTYIIPSIAIPSFSYSDSRLITSNRDKNCLSAIFQRV